MTLEDAIILAADRHRGQRDKGDEPYILHPLRVALRLRTDHERLAAVLHDVVEDTGVATDDLRERGLDEAVVAAIEALTKRDGENYATFIERVAANPIARTVKLADLADNLDPDRPHNSPPKSSSAYGTNTNRRVSGSRGRQHRCGPSPTSGGSSIYHAIEPATWATRWSLSSTPASMSPPGHRVSIPWQGPASCSRAPTRRLDVTSHS